jgi:DNA modification methylase
VSGRAVVLRGDARHLPLPDASVDLICTSPPFWALRSYTDGGAHYGGQIGSEATPGEYVAALVECTREWVRVLKPSGSLFVNLGDKYDSSSHSMQGTSSRHHIGQRGHFERRPVFGHPKSLLGLPWRYALACIDQLGLILRAEIVWAKPNGLPESVTDRVRRAHEQVFHLTRLPRYYAAVDEIREPHTATLTGRSTRGWAQGPSGNREIGRGQWDETVRDFATSPLGKLPGSVWAIPSSPLTVPAHLGVDHFAAYPPELCRRIILGWSPPGVCTACGEGRRPVHEVANIEDRKGRVQRIIDYSLDAAHGPDGRGGERWKQTVTITGYACGCPDPSAPTRPAIVLDPFAGTGTTMLVAAAYGRTGIGVDRSMDYARLARWRVNDPGERARVLHQPKPPPVPEGQAALFEVTG